MKKYQLQEIDNPVLESIQSACLESGDIGRAIILAYARRYRNMVGRRDAV